MIPWYLLVGNFLDLLLQWLRTGPVGPGYCLISGDLWYVSDSSHPMGPSGIEAAPGEVTVSLGQMGGSLQATRVKTVKVSYG